ncbi:dynein associated protein-domain-containing protein [Auriculariales sp. MPI-PUGE-AT-0066]|nr:dynein associated protein-domain-containing protein [Auriculariales sp. MPI-PUGE-AT-0066]
MPAADPPLGALVEYQGMRGIVKFYGVTQFQSTGKWAGIALLEPKGKNDGSVQGIQYFTCTPGHGVFVRVSQVTMINANGDATPTTPRNPVRAPTTPVTPTTNGRTGSTRPGVHQRAGSMAVAGRTPLSASTSARTTPAASRADTPPSRGSTAVSRANGPSPVKRSSTLFQSQTQARQQVPPSPSTSTSAPPQPDPGLQTSPPRSPVRQPSVRLQSPIRVSSSPIAELVATSPVSPGPPPPPAISAEELAALREQELTLQRQLRVAEIKRTDDSQRIRELESRLADAEHFVALRPKLQAKLNSLQTDLVETRRTLADQNDLNALTEAKLNEISEHLEMAMLDKEVAEERAEALESECEAMKEQLAELEVELNVLKSDREGGDGEAAVDMAKSSLAYIQLERQNERMKEALVRLRDISHETDIENKRKIQELERDLNNLDDLQSQYENALAKLENADVHIEELKAQVDNALGAEEILLELTEKNLEMAEKIAEMQIIIEDYEQLKEIGDELEESHQETERDLLEDIERKDAIIRDMVRKIDHLEESLQDTEQTILSFRDLVLQLQYEMEALRAQNQSAQIESQVQATQSAAMLTINLKLQSTAVKNQARAIESELRRAEAQEGRELVAIIQPYLPQVYMDLDGNSLNTYLFFQRIATKADLINNIVGQIHSLPESLNGTVTENLAMVCEMRGRICNMSTLAKRFAAVLRRCDAASFLDIGRIYAEVLPMEKRIDMHIDLLKRDEFREFECQTDVHKIAAQFEHLRDIHFANFDHDLAERELYMATAIDSDLDMFSAAIGLLRTAVKAHIKEEEVPPQYDDLDPEETLFGPLQLLQDQTRGAKVLSRKLVKRIEDLRADSNALRPHILTSFSSLSSTFSKAIDFGVTLSQKVVEYLGGLRQSKEPLKLSVILGFVREVAMAHGTLDGGSAWGVLDNLLKQLVNDAGALVPLALESENVIKISGISPWIVRVDEIRAAAAINVEAERKAAQLGEELQELVRSIKTRDQSIQESAVKIELMERRLESVKRQGDTIVELEADLAKARKQDKIYQDAIDQLQTDYDQLEQENVKLKQAAPAERQPSGAQHAEGETLAVETNLETSHLLEQIDSLRGSVRFLRHENSYLKGQDLLKEIRQLPELPTFNPPPLTRSDSPTPSEASTDGPSTPPSTLRSITLETKTLYRDVIAFSSAPKMVDLSALNKRKAEGVSGWMPARHTPAHQLLERKRAVDELQRKVRALKERTATVVPRS